MRKTVLGAVTVLLATGAFLIVGQGTRSQCLVVGLALMVIGFPLVLLSRLHLGKAFAVLPKATTLVTSGVYSKIPHPLFAFLDLALLGIVVAVRQQWLLVVWLILVMVHVWEAGREARVLEQAFGDEYRTVQGADVVVTRVTRLRTTPFLWPVVLVLLLVAYLRWLSPSVSPYAGGSDSSGYLWSARLFRQGTLSVPIDVPQKFPVETVGAQAFIPLGGTVRPGTMTLVPTYPTGLPLHLAAAHLLLDDENGVKGVLLLAAAGALVLLYLLGRDAGLPRLWAAGGSAILACSPLFLLIAVQPFSDVLATLWAEAAVLSAWRARRRPALAWLAGASLGIATLVRPTNLILILPVLAALAPGLGSYTRLIGGGLPFAAFVLAYQAWAYGNPFRSGYGDVRLAFTWSAVPQSLRHYLMWCPQLASWIVVFLPAAAWAWRGPLARWRLVAAAWAIATLGTVRLLRPDLGNVVVHAIRPAGIPDPDRGRPRRASRDRSGGITACDQSTGCAGDRRGGVRPRAAVRGCAHRKSPVRRPSIGQGRRARLPGRPDDDRDRRGLAAANADDADERGGELLSARYDLPPLRPSFAPGVAGDPGVAAPAAAGNRGSAV